MTRRAFSLMLLVLPLLLLGSCNADDLVSLDPYVTGVVVDDASNQPLDNVVLTIQGRTARTAQSGTFFIGDLREGESTLTATKDGYADLSRAVTVRDDDATPLTLRMQRR